MKNKTIRIFKHGGIGNMHWEEVQIDKPRKGEVLLKHNAIGVNFIDVYQRSGLYPLDLPATLGLEAAGTIQAMGAGIKDFEVGDRVAYCTALGSYAQYRLIAVDKLIKIPGYLSDEQAAAMMLKGLTAEYLIRRLYKVDANDRVLLYAAAGGVGSILSQWLKQLGAFVIGVVGNKEKVAPALKMGCNQVIVYNRKNPQDSLSEQVLELTKGSGVTVAYDSIGKTTFDATINSLSRRGMFVSYGNASGAVAPFSPSILAEGNAQGGSLFFTRPRLFDYLSTQDELQNAAQGLFDAVQKGIKINVGNRFALKDAAEAHNTLEKGETTGSMLLIP